MTTAAINTVVTMLEQVPDNIQNQVIEHLAEYLAEIKDNEKWEKSFAQPLSPTLLNMIKQAETDIKEGKIIPLTDNIFNK